MFCGSVTFFINTKFISFFFFFYLTACHRASPAVVKGSKTSFLIFLQFYNTDIGTVGFIKRNFGH